MKKGVKLAHFDKFINSCKDYTNLTRQVDEANP